MRHVVRGIIIAIIAIALMPASLAAQDSNFALTSVPRPEPGAGWTFTPSILYQGTWDDNVLLRGRGDEAPRDFLNVVNPKADLSYSGRRSDVALGYDGAFLFYRRLGDLNSYSQHASMSARRLITRHITLFLTDTAAAVPTTELVQFLAVPFIRTGSQLNDLRAGVDAALTKRTSMKIGYDFEWVRFQHDTPLALLLHGGHSHGASIALRHAVGPRTTLLADYDVRHAIVANNGTFIQTVDAGVEHHLTDTTRVYAAGGVARLAITDFGPARTGPSVRAGILHQRQRAAVELAYSRTFVPAFGFGGTYQNEEIAGFVRAPISRRVYTISSVSWRRNEPLTSSDVHLESIWIEGTLGFAVQPWVRLEAFYSASHQNDHTAGTFGGARGRNRAGFQIVTVKPLRAR
jgi:hypothetical protein